MENIVLKPGKDKAVRNRHHWIFSGAVADWPDFENGDILQVRSSAGDLLGHAYFNKKCSISGRMLSFGKTDPQEAFRDNIGRALALRRCYFDRGLTNAYRLINSEGDLLPGLIVDVYDDILVIQIGTLGMEKLKPLVLEELKLGLSPKSIFEKSVLHSRQEEGLTDFSGLLSGAEFDQIRILEEGLPFLVDVRHSQKTGFYLDQREMRKTVKTFASGRRVLNVFSYTGAFSVAALKGGAQRADSVDTSESALEMARENFGINELSPETGDFITADAFEFLRIENLDYDFIILDPPAFAKKKPDVVQACRGYKDINRLAFQRVRPNGLVLTFSCSHFVDEGLFQKVLFQAAQESGRRVRILQKHRQALDHPVNIYHPETAYLKGFLLFVE
jgi:23S rRNA (cytosine1962-C5)-methyltransferase